ncbi:MAG: NAD(P)H-binding protein [Pseudomarimonas sp.]
MSERIIVAGGTGLIGRRVVDRLVADGGALVLSVQRREDEESRHGLRVVVDDGADVDTLALRLGKPPPRAFICALGTTRKVAGSDAAFVAVDRDLVVRIAKAAFAAGARHAIVVSSAGADAKSTNLYLRTKGEMEALVAAVGFTRCDFLRPGLLIGQRTTRRPTESLMQTASPLIDSFLKGALKRYRSIAAEDVAEAAVILATSDQPAVLVHEFGSLQALAHGTSPRR